MQWYVYIIRSKARDKRYTGITTDPDRRLKEHNESRKGAKATKAGRPWKLAYLEPVESRSAALILENKIKHMSRLQKLYLIKHKGIQGGPNEGDQIIFRNTLEGTRVPHQDG